MIFHTRDSIALNVSDEGSGPAFVFQHGLGGDASQPAEVFPQGSGYRRVTVECRGHGQSESGPISAFSIQPFADDIAEYVERHLPKPVVLGGISMGAAIALNLAVRKPQLVKALVIARPAWLFDDNPQNMAPNAFAGSVMAVKEGAEALAVFEASSTAQTLAREAPDNLMSLRGFFARDNRAMLAQLLMRISADGPKVTRADLQALAVPALVIGTDQDQVHPFSHARIIAETIPGAKLVKITSKSTSRTAYITDFKAALADFLREVPK
jgi:pimeloyl-ACP methyl ester carboxylesterase